MLSQVQARIDRIELSINLLEEHLHKFGNQLLPRPLKFIRNQIKFFKHELQIRRDYPP
ncbi:MAG: hypothetical protein V3V33_00980 [Candidatus Lokiarchaeia archaeon]